MKKKRYEETKELAKNKSKIKDAYLSSSKEDYAISLQKNIFLLIWPFVFIGIFLYAYQTKETGAVVISFIAFSIFLIRWAQLRKQEKLSVKKQPKKENLSIKARPEQEKLKIKPTTKEGKILRFQLAFFILSAILILYPSTMFVSPEKFTIYFYLGGWLLSIVSSVFFVCLLDWKRVFDILITVVFFPPSWFFICALGAAFTPKSISDTSVSNTFLTGMSLGCAIYFGLILKAEGILEEKSNTKKNK